MVCGREREKQKQAGFETKAGKGVRMRVSGKEAGVRGRINNFIADHIEMSFTSQSAPISYSRDTLPSPSTSSSLNIEVISLRLTLSRGDRFKSSISFRNYEKSMKLL
jgi:hypothetical protein